MCWGGKIAASTSVVGLGILANVNKNKKTSESEAAKPEASCLGSTSPPASNKQHNMQPTTEGTQQQPQTTATTEHTAIPSSPLATTTMGGGVGGGGTSADTLYIKTALPHANAGGSTTPAAHNRCADEFCGEQMSHICLAHTVFAPRPLVFFYFLMLFDLLFCVFFSILKKPL